MDKLKIGITVDLKNSLFTNGINQNAVYLSLMFEEIGHECVLIYSGDGGETAKGELERLGIDVSLASLSESFETRFDVIISVGFVVTNMFYGYLTKQNPDIKFVRYQCGNQFFILNETILYGAHEKRQAQNTIPFNDPKPDQIWSIPQMEHTNLDFYTYIDKGQRNATVVPFVWDPIVTDSYINSSDKYTTWKPRDHKRIGIMEPNISLMKNMIYPLVVVSRFLEDGNKLDQVIAYSASQYSENKDLIRFVRQGHPDLLKKLKVLGRYPTIHVLNTQIDAVVSWQIENALNYLYLDIAWLGWPIIHNAHLCQDIGYYYPYQDMGEATAQIESAFQNHTVEWRDEQRAKIKRYTRENKQVLKDYQKLLENLINNDFKKQEYDWQTNSIKDL